MSTGPLRASARDRKTCEVMSSAVAVWRKHGKLAHPMPPWQHQVVALVDVPGTHHAFLSADMQANDEHYARQQHAVYLATSIYCLYTLHATKSCHCIGMINASHRTEESRNQQRHVVSSTFIEGLLKLRAMDRFTTARTTRITNQTE